MLARLGLRLFNPDISGMLAAVGLFLLTRCLDRGFHSNRPATAPNKA